MNRCQHKCPVRSLEVRKATGNVSTRSWGTLVGENWGDQIFNPVSAFLFLSFGGAHYLEFTSSNLSIHFLKDTILFEFYASAQVSIILCSPHNTSTRYTVLASNYWLGCWSPKRNNIYYTSRLVSHPHCLWSSKLVRPCLKTTYYLYIMGT